MSLLVDTSVWSLALRRDVEQSAPEVVALRHALLGTDQVFTTGLVLQELLQGFAGLKDRAQLVNALAAQEGRGRCRQGDGSDFGCPQSSEVDLTGSTRIVTSQTSHPMFMLTEIRRHAKCGLFLSHFPRALILAPESCVRLNGWSA